MNFNQWYNQYNPRFVPNQKQIAKDAWEGCKKQIIEILVQNSNKNRHPDDYNDYVTDDYIDNSAVEEIDKL